MPIAAIPIIYDITGLPDGSFLISTENYQDQTNAPTKFVANLISRQSWDLIGITTLPDGSLLYNLSDSTDDNNEVILSGLGLTDIAISKLDISAYTLIIIPFVYGSVNVSNTPEVSVGIIGLIKFPSFTIAVTNTPGVVVGIGATSLTSLVDFGASVTNTPVVAVSLNAATLSAYFSVGITNTPAMAVSIIPIGNGIFSAGVTNTPEVSINCITDLAFFSVGISNNPIVGAPLYVYRELVEFSITIGMGQSVSLELISGVLTRLDVERHIFS